MNIIDQARSNYVQALSLDESALPRDSNRWPQFRVEMNQAIRAFPSHLEAIRYAQTRKIFDHRRPAAGLERDFVLYRGVLLSEYPHFSAFIDSFSDSPVSVAESLGLLNGKILVSNVLYFHMFHILTCLTHKSDISRICEIGGGYGALARLWLTNPIRPIDNYTIIDLPESLFFAECFLRASLPAWRILYCQSDTDRDNSDPRTIYLVPHANSGRTARMRFDVVSNTGSIGELTDAWAIFWAEWIGRQQCNLFYSHNYFGNPIDRLYEGRSILSPRVPPGWRVASLRVNPPLMLLQSSGRYSAEMILARSPAPASAKWIYDVQRAQEPEALGLRELAYYVFNLPDMKEADVHAESRFLTKCIASFKYAPKELLYLASRIVASSAFDSLPIGDRRLVEDLRARLEASFRKSHPIGHSAT